jgi:hypothetical protein
VAGSMGDSAAAEVPCSELELILTNAVRFKFNNVFCSTFAHLFVIDCFRVKTRALANRCLLAAGDVDVQTLQSLFGRVIFFTQKN